MKSLRAVLVGDTVYSYSFNSVDRGVTYCAVCAVETRQGVYCRNCFRWCHIPTSEGECAYSDDDIMTTGPRSFECADCRGEE